MSKLSKTPIDDSNHRTIPEGTKLDNGSHATFADGHCAMELVAWLAREPHSDRPSCASPVIGAFVRSWNDTLNGEDRNRLLLPIVPKLVDTAVSREVEEARVWMATDWLIRVYAPAFLELVPELRCHAKALSELPEVHSRASAKSVEGVTGAAQEAAWDARDTARDTAQAAARDAELDASRTVGWIAAQAAAQASAQAAAWDAALDASRTVGWIAAQAAARSAAKAAAQAAAQAAARISAESAVWDALKPTVEKLQKSAVELLIRMIEKGSHEQSK